MDSIKGVINLILLRESKPVLLKFRCDNKKEVILPTCPDYSNGS